MLRAQVIRDDFSRFSPERSRVTTSRVIQLGCADLGNIIEKRVCELLGRQLPELREAVLTAREDARMKALLLGLHALKELGALRVCCSIPESAGPAKG
jgi:hypothetical protein